MNIIADAFLIVCILVAAAGLVHALMLWRQRPRVMWRHAARGVNALIKDGFCIHDRTVGSWKVNCSCQGRVNCADCWCTVLGLDRAEILKLIRKGL